jgi:hypothetical protein
VALHAFAPQFVAAVTERPLAAPLARYQAAQEPCAVNAWHQPLQLGPLDRQVLARLDGRLDEDALVATIRGLELDVEENLAGQVRASLERLARHAFLIG